MRWRRLLPFLLLWLVPNSVAQSVPAENSVLPVGLLVIQPTRLPQSLQQFEGQSIFLPIAYGTGFVVRDDGYVVTALHVVRKAESRLPEIQASGKQVVACLNAPAGAYECEEVEVVGTDDRNDLAVLKIKRPMGPESLRALSLASEKPTVDAELWAAGYPERNARKLAVASGKFFSGDVPGDASAKVDPTTPAGKLWFAEMKVENGESGGPVYLRNGSVIGVMVTRSDTHAIAGFVPAQHVIDLLARSGVTEPSVNNPPKTTAGP